MKKAKVYTERQLKQVAKKERIKAAQAVMDLFYALREIGGSPNLKDLVKLAKRIKSDSKT